jgi:hypothetical protein
VILAPNFPESLPLLPFALIIHMLVVFIGCVLLALGTIVPEPFAKDFQDQAFDEFQFLFVKQHGKCPLTSLYLCPFSLFYRCRIT